MRQCLTPIAWLLFAPLVMAPRATAQQPAPGSQTPDSNDVRSAPIGILDLGSGSLQPRSDLVPAGSTKIRFEGRWHRQSPDGAAVTVNTGSLFRLRFTGESCRLQFDTRRDVTPGPHLWMRLDNDEWREISVIPEVDLTARGTDPHTLQVIFKGADERQSRWDPPLEAHVTFVGLRLAPGGRLLDPPDEPSLSIEFLGDSITEGVFVNGTGEARPEVDDALRTYAFQTAEALKAYFRIVGFGLIGITRPGNGGVPDALEAFPYVYGGQLKDRFQPRLCVINLGTNDAAADSALFSERYAAYLRLIRADYPEALLVCMRPFNGAHADDIRRTVQRRRADGDPRAYYVDTTGWIDPARDTTDGLHPSAAGHARAARRLTSALRALLPELHRPLLP
jgi:lysophospholipase L1-like esterase